MGDGVILLRGELSCTSCGHASGLLLRARDLNRKTSSHQFAYYRCFACGLVSQYPIPENMSVYYPSDYPQYAIPPTLDEFKEEAIATRSRVSFVQDFVSTGKLLEIGAGYGAFSYMAQQNGFEVQAVEMDSSCCNYMKKIGIRAICTSSLESMDSLLGEFDAIVLWHVIEHLENFRKAITVLSRHLTPSGLLVICSPNPASLQFKLFRRFWVSLDAPRHLWLIPVPVLVRCAAQSGLEAIFASTSDPEALAFNKWCWEASLNNLMIWAGLMPELGIRAIVRRKGGMKKFVDIGRRLAFKSLTIMLARTLNLILAPLERSGSRGTSYSAVFKKNGSHDCS